MRKKLLDQLPLTPVPIDHVHAAEVGAMSDVLDQLPEAVARVHEDLCWRGKRRIDPRKGRRHGGGAGASRGGAEAAARLQLREARLRAGGLQHVPLVLSHRPRAEGADADLRSRRT